MKTRLATEPQSHGGGNSKPQAPNPKQIPNPRTQIPHQPGPCLELWSSARLFGLWVLGFGICILCVSVAIPLQAQDQAPDMSRPAVERIRIEGFAWQLESQKLRWAVTTGNSDEEGNFVALGPARNCELSLEEATLRCSDATQEFAPPYVHHLSEDIGSLLLHLFEMSSPDVGAEPEPEPETPETPSEKVEREYRASLTRSHLINALSPAIVRARRKSLCVQPLFRVRARFQPCRKRPGKQGASAPEVTSDLADCLIQPIYEAASKDRHSYLSGQAGSLVPTLRGRTIPCH